MKIECIKLYNDLELKKQIMPGTVYEVSPKRGTKLIAGKVAVEVKNSKKEEEAQEVPAVNPMAIAPSTNGADPDTTVPEKKKSSKKTKTE